jgi:hypothetical protein
VRALAPPLAKPPAGRVFDEKTEQGARQVKTIGASIIFALLIYGILALPGLLSDRDSILVPVSQAVRH